MNKVRLVLFPQDAESPKIDPAVLAKGLRGIGLIGAQVRSAMNRYQPGGQFMGLITFLGCSPTIASASQAGDDPNVYAVELPTPVDDIQLIAGSRLRAPRCPECSAEKSRWHGTPASAQEVFACDQCGYRGECWHWDWRRQAGFGRSWINVWGVHEGEAVPGEKLMDALQRLSGFVWNYAYCKD